ncbi:hypothetical protein MSG28_010419 [Choristoneura fumiferana]|uniref:Uncharacterized protein n=1 Tax=Choristoneura fumiferana TaxID=7141 RepID=A0ACC0KL81_CHOFU|nr:hypothetical protein MSG28_010419 [Choristoneura fumiferana]
MYRINLLLVGFATHVLSEPIKYCDYNTSVDISQGTHISNGDINFDGERYQQHEYFFDKKTGTQRGCICWKKICVRKCCPLGQGYTQNKSCANVSSPFDPPIWDDYGELKGVDVSKFHLLFGKVECLNAARLKLSQISDNLHLLKDPETKKNFTRLDALVCFANEDEEHNYTSSYVLLSGMLISCVFFIVTIAVYAWLPELQNLHGRVLMVYLACMCVGFAFLSSMQILLTVDNITINVCLGLTFVIYFALLSAFFWLNVMCFDIWWTFRTRRPRRTSPGLMRSYCFANEDEEHNYTVVTFVSMLISCVFFIVTIAVYAWLPRTPKSARARFDGLPGLHILLTVDNITINVCLGLTFVIYFALLSAFFWLNVMCFDIWWTFSGKRGLSLERWSMRARFCAYAAYAFGFPTGLTVLLAALEFSGRSKFNEMFQISQSDSGDLRTIGNRDVKNWKEYQQQRGSLDTVRTSICCDSDNIRTTKTSSF